MIDIAGLAIDPAVVEHPLLGPSHVIAHAGAAITAMSAIDWQRPTQIPAIAEPRKLPPGAGTLLMNLIAERARDAGVSALRYAGPYPTHALYRTLLQSFHTDGAEDEFTKDVLARSLRIGRTEIPIDFRPAPFQRRTTAFGHVDVREGSVERASIAGVLYERTGDSLAKLSPSGRNAMIAVDGAAQMIVLARIAELDERGELVEGPHPIPAFPAAANGSRFPPELAEQLAELASLLVPAPLAEDVRRLLGMRPIRWADLAWRSATRTDDGFALHVAFLALANHDMARFAQLLSYHLARIAQAAVLDEVLASRP